MEIELLGKDENEQFRKIMMKFHGAVCNQHPSARFTPELYDSYDKVVELVDSEWLNKQKRMKMTFMIGNKSTMWGPIRAIAVCMTADDNKEVGASC